VRKLPPHQDKRARRQVSELALAHTHHYHHHYASPVQRIDNQLRRAVDPLRPREFTHLAADYERAIDRILNANKRGVRELISGYRDALKSKRADRFDAEISEEDAIGKLLSKVNGLELDFIDIVESDHTARVIDGKLQALSNHNAVDIKQQFAKVIGIDPITEDDGVKAALKATLNTSLSKLKSVNQQYHAELRSVLVKGYMAGTPYDEMADLISERFNVSKSRGHFIAWNEFGNLNGALTEHRQVANGVTRYTWRTSIDERVRPSHVIKENEVFEWSKPPDTGHPGFDFRCFPGDSELNHGLFAEVFNRRWHIGELTTIVTSSGKTIRATPNHPVLTARGWRAIGSINVGDDVIEARSKFIGAPEHDIDNVEFTFDQAFNALALAFPAVRHRGFSSQFHGDGSDFEIDVIDINGVLPDMFNVAAHKRVCEEILAYANATCSDDVLTQLSALPDVFNRLFGTTRGIIRGACKLLALIAGHGGHSDEHGIRTISDFGARFQQAFPDDVARYAECFGKSLFADATDVGFNDRARIDVMAIMRGALTNDTDINTFAPERGAKAIRIAPHDLSDVLERVALTQHVSRVVEKSISEFIGHVYNLQTVPGYYVADGIISKNCRCTAEPVFDDMLDDDDFDFDDEPELDPRTAGEQ